MFYNQLAVGTAKEFRKASRFKVIRFPFPYEKF